VLERKEEIVIRESFEVSAVTVNEAKKKALELLGLNGNEHELKVEVLEEGNANRGFTALRKEARVRVTHQSEGFGHVSRELSDAIPAPPPTAHDASVRRLAWSASSSSRPFSAKPELVIKEAAPPPRVSEMKIAPSKERPREVYEPSPEHNAKVEEVARELLDAMEIEYELSFEHSEYQRVFVTVPEDDAGALIGRRGTGVDALEHVLARMIAQRCDANVPVQVDLNGYREREEERLRAQALERAERVLAEGIEIHFEPMHPRDRRVVHLAVKPLEGVESYTLGEGARRHVVLAPVDAAGK